MAVEIKSIGSVEMIIKGQTLLVKKPTLAVQASYEQAVKSAGTDGTSIYNAMISWLSAVGISEDVAKQLDYDEFVQISEALNGVKKN